MGGGHVQGPMLRCSHCWASSGHTSRAHSIFFDCIVSVAVGEVPAFGLLRRHPETQKGGGGAWEGRSPL